MAFVQIPQAWCTCGQEIGAARVSYDSMVASGISKEEAMNRLGLIRICCRTQIAGKITHKMEESQRGTINREILAQSSTQRSSSFNTTFQQPERKVLGIEETKHAPTNISRRAAAASSSSSPREGERTRRRLRVPAPSESVVKDLFNEPETVYKDGIPEQLFGIEEPIDPEFDPATVKRGQYRSDGYARDDEGNIIMVHVGCGLSVPMLVTEKWV